VGKPETPNSLERISGDASRGLPDLATAFQFIATERQTSSLPDDDAAGDPVAGVPGRVRHLVVRLGMDDDRGAVRAQEGRRDTHIEGRIQKRLGTN